MTANTTTGRPGLSGVDRSIRVLTSATVVGLAGVAGALSYSHMHQLAVEHGEQGWRAHSFPLSVDGIEIVASLVLLAHQRSNTRAGVLPWAALITGTAASLAANVAVASSDLIGRAVAGWPAVALLVAIKLFSGLLDSHPEPAAAARPPSPRRSGPGALHDRSASGPAGGRWRTDGPRPDADRDGDRDGELEVVARTVAGELAASGQRVTRDSLTRALRERGHAVANARASHLLTLLRQQAELPSARPLRRVGGGGSDA